MTRLSNKLKAFHERSEIRQNHDKREFTEEYEKGKTKNKKRLLLLSPGQMK